MDINKRFEHDKLKKFQIFNAAQLKYIAFTSMLIDHVNNSIVTHFLNGKGALLYISNFLSILGRIAFPIFIFFIVLRDLDNSVEYLKAHDYVDDSIVDENSKVVVTKDDVGDLVKVNVSVTNGDIAKDVSFYKEK